MIKRLLKLGITLSLMVGLAITSFTPPPALSSQEQVMNLTLEQALALAEKDSPDIKLAAIARDNKSIALDKADDAAHSVKKSSAGRTGGNLQDFMDRDVTPAVAKKAYDGAQMDYDQAIKLVKLGVTSAYYNLLSARTTLTNKQDSAARSREALQMVEAKYKVGTAAKLEVDSQKVTVATDDAAVSQAQQDLKEAQLAFNKLLLLPINQQVNPTSAIKLLDYTVDYDKALATALVEDSSLRSAELTLYEAQLTKDVVEKFVPGTYQDRQAIKAYEASQISVDKAKYDVNIKVLTAYNSLQSAKQQYEILASQVKVAEDTARLTKLRYQVGMATLYDVNTASTQLEGVKQQYQGAIFAYNLAVSKFEYGVYSTSSGN